MISLEMELETTEMTLGELIQQRKTSLVRHRGAAVHANPKYVLISSPSSSSSSSSSSSLAVHLLLPAVILVVYNSCLILTLLQFHKIYHHLFRSEQSS